MFYLLFLLTPLIFSSRTSEIFEFNKMVFVYVCTIFAVFLWTVESIKNKKLNFKKTVLGIPIMIFLGSQVVSTIFSIDKQTSIFGYYGRFNGGLLSAVCYAILYWAFVSHMDRLKTKKVITFLLISGIIVGFWSMLEHFGYSFGCLILRNSFTTSCWQEDVRSRVFASLGQPNWLAAYITAILPIVWAKIAKDRKILIWNAISTLFFVTILFTKSRSGILGFVASFIIFWGILFVKNKKKILRQFLIVSFSLLLTFSITQSTIKQTVQSTPVGEGGTDSGEIRKTVWKGAIEIWKHYPIYGSGPETFAYSYEKFKPLAQNLNSEWDYVYSKAHNEYLNYLANSGLLGLFGYLTLIGFSLLVIFKLIFNSKYKGGNLELQIALFSGFASILVTNFFGFLVVANNILFFLFPAIAIAIGKPSPTKRNPSILNFKQTVLLGVTVVIFAFLLISAGRYWYGDTLYASGKKLNDEGNPIAASAKIKAALSLSPNEPLYWIELSKSYKNIAINFHSDTIAEGSVKAAWVATTLSPVNTIIKKITYANLADLAVIDQKYLEKALLEIESAIRISPNDPELFYYRGVCFERLKKFPQARASLEKALNLKPDYIKALSRLTELDKRQ